MGTGSDERRGRTGVGVRRLVAGHRWLLAALAVLVAVRLFPVGSVLHPDGYVSVFELVAGATLTGRDTPGSRVAAETTVPLPTGSFRFRRVAAVDDAGRFAVTVPHPGRYEVGGDAVRVTERQVRTGATVPVD
jgi:asparagine N-glycosylation enzyme membrane subunit Stt3